MNASQAITARYVGAYVTVHLIGGAQLAGHVSSHDEAETANVLTLTERYEGHDHGEGTLWAVPLSAVLYVKQRCD